MVNIKVPPNMKDQMILTPSTILKPNLFDCIVCLGILQKIDH
jgi:hypothetical protein